MPSSGSPVTLLLLHGTGGNEDDLVGLGKTLLPGAALLSPRGKVLENGMPRFFRRLAEGVFDMDDLARRTDELAGFVSRASGAYGFDGKRVVAVGYSNGANVAASMLFSHPDALAGAVLLRVMNAFGPRVPDVAGKKILIEAGTQDRLIQREQPETLARLLKNGHAEVTLRWQQHAGHQLIQSDVDDAKRWLAENFGKGP